MREEQKLVELGEATALTHGIPEKQEFEEVLGEDFRD
jgi:hypothetical protein